MFTCSLYPHPMLKSEEYKLFLYFLQVEMFRNFIILRDQEISLWRFLNAETIFIKLTLFFFQIKLLLTQMPKQTNSSLM